MADPADTAEKRIKAGGNAAEVAQDMGRQIAAEGDTDDVSLVAGDLCDAVVLVNGLISKLAAEGVIVAFENVDVTRAADRGLVTHLRVASITRTNTIMPKRREKT